MTTTLSLVVLLKAGGVMHLGLVCAGMLMPRVVGLRDNLAGLPQFIRRLFWVYYSFIGLCLVGFGVITFTQADSLASGTVLARAVCVFLAAFWMLRLVAAAFVFDLTPYLTNRWRRLGYYATNVAFAFLPLIYAAAAFKGGAS